MNVSNCIIRSCVATGGNPYGGGAMYFFLSTSTISDCLFENNRLDLDPGSSSGEAMGGAVMSWASSPTFVDCIFRNNRVSETPRTDLRMGGAIWASASGPVIRQCLFEDNSALSGGAVGWWNRSTPRVEACTFRNNRAEELGGAICHIYNEKDTAEEMLWVRDSRFEGNRGDTGAAMFIARNNRVTVSNCLFTGNHAETNGSGIAVQDGSECRIEHCTLAGNTVDATASAGGCILLDGTGSVRITGTIVAFNSGLHGIELTAGGDPQIHQIDHCDIYGHILNYSMNLVDRTGWNGNISADPLFVSTGIDGEYRLSEPATGDPGQAAAGRSPAIDTAGHPVSGYPQTHQTTRTDSAG
ncbi:MAG TPA: right-handed parallel beta-helix repeat-containing protein, partial [bacterium]|nr:right-handed parallel beta-helix repeat-containing protein [bacterium]